MNNTLETITDGQGRQLTHHLKRRERREWLKVNINKLGYLQYIYVKKKGGTYKIMLNTYKEKYEETTF
jgi:hypothetical protein